MALAARDCEGVKSAIANGADVNAPFADGLTPLCRASALGEKRASFGDDTLLQWATRRGLQTMYESAGLCVFCCQFFQDGWRE